MSLFLAIESSSSPFGVALGTPEDVYFNSMDEEGLQELRDIPFLVEKAFEATAFVPSQLDGIIVNIGPGGLSSVRSGVAFANGLSFALKTPLYVYNSFELMGYEAWERHKLPILCTARSVKNNAYVGLYINGDMRALKYGDLEETVKDIVHGLSGVVVAGAHRELIAQKLDTMDVVDSGMKTGTATALLSMVQAFPRTALTYPDFAIPVNERSKEFHQEVNT